MKQKHTLQWLSAVTGRAKGLVGLLVVVQTVLSVSSIAFAFILRRIINMAVQGASTGFRSSFVLLAGVIAAQIALGAAGRFLSEYTTTTVENRFKHRLFSALLTGNYASVTAVHSGEWMNRLTSDTTIFCRQILIFYARIDIHRRPQCYANHCCHQHPAFDDKIIFVLRTGNSLKETLHHIDPHERSGICLVFLCHILNSSLNLFWCQLHFTIIPPYICGSHYQPETALHIP